jgi:uracil-DNA glycosylase family 4
MPAERDDEGKLVRFRGPADSPDCKDCPCARQGKPIKPVRAHGATGGLMVVGEGPGSEEVFQGFPFVGPSGRIITGVFQKNRLDRSLMWITNALLCARPKDDEQFAKAVECCRPRLLEEIPAVRPTAILALGGTAVRTLKLPVHTIIEARGTVQESPFAPGIPVITTIHPAALLKGGAGETGGGKNKMNVDAQHMFLEADITKAYRMAMGQIAPSWSDDIDVHVEPGPAQVAPELPVAPNTSADAAAPAPAAEDPLDGYDRAFLTFQTEHPQVYEILVGVAREAISLNVPAGMFWGAAGFELRRAKADFPVAYREQYARFIATQDPNLAAFFGGLR